MCCFTVVMLGASACRDTPAAPTSGPILATALTLDGGPTHPLLRGQSRRFTPDQTPFWAGVDCFENHIEVRVGTFPDQWTVSLGAPRGQRLTRGAYENATTYPFNQFAGGTGIRVGGEGRGCDDVGRFDVWEASFNASGSVERFHATFEHRCERFADALVGEITLLNPPGTQASCP